MRRPPRIRVQCSQCLTSILIPNARLGEDYNATAWCADCQRKEYPDMDETEYREAKAAEATRRKATNAKR